MPANETVLYRGARFELGRGPGFYGIWPAGAPRPPSIEWWPETPEGWQGAWSRFTGLETPATFAAVTSPATMAPIGPPAPSGPPAPAGPPGVAVPRARAVVAAALLAVGVGCGIAGLFPGYLGGASLAQQPAQLVTHAIFLAVWSASALLILRGGALVRVGALLGLGTSIVTFGLFFADAGTAIAGGAHVMGAGLMLGLIGWLACAAGSATAVRFRLSELPGGRGGRDRGRIVTLGVATAAALGTTAAFAPSWDSYTLRTAGGAAQSLTAGNAFANPAPVIAGNVAVMVALVVVAATAAWWRPVRLGAVLLAGALIPMAAEAISALVQLGEATSPVQFGISRAQAAQAGLTISSGLTPAFWIYCAFVLALAATCAWMLFRPRRAAPGRGPHSSGPAQPFPGLKTPNGSSARRTPDCSPGPEQLACVVAVPDRDQRPVQCPDSRHLLTPMSAHQRSTRLRTPDIPSKICLATTPRSHTPAGGTGGTPARSKPAFLEQPPFQLPEWRRPDHLP